MRFYQMDADALAKQLNSDINTGLENVMTERSPRFTKTALQMVVSAFNSIRSKLTPTVIIPLIFYFLTLVFSVLNRQWSVLLLAIIALVVTVVFYVAEEWILVLLKKKYSDRISAEGKAVWVVRNGKKVRITAEELLVGDLVFLSEGTILFGDARVLRGENLFATESAVFNSNIPAAKFAGAIEQDNLPPERQENMLWKGSYIHSGSGMCMITALGADCYIEKTGGRAKKKHRSVFYRRQDNVGRWVTFLFSVLTVVLLLISAFLTGCYVEVFLTLATVTSLILLSPISALTEWTYYRTAEKFYEKGVLVRNFEAFDRMQQEKNVSIDIKSLLNGNLSFSQIIPLEKAEEECLTYFALCSEGGSLGSVVCDQLKRSGIGDKAIQQLLIGSRRSNDSKGNACGIFMNGSQSIAAVSGYWKDVENYLEPLDDALLHHIDELEKHGKMVYFVAGRRSEDTVSFPQSGFKAYGLMVFNVRADKACLDITHQLHRAGVLTHLVNPYTNSLGASIAALYDMDDAVNELPRSDVGAVSFDALPIEKEQANLIYHDLDSFTAAVYQTKCMFCGLKRALSFIAMLGLFAVFAIFTMLLCRMPIASIIVPMLLMRLLFLAPGYFLVESARNCNQFKRSVVLGVFCGAAGLFAALLRMDMALLIMQISAVFLAGYLWVANRSYIGFSKRIMVLLLLLLVAVIFPWLFMAGNWFAMLLIALFAPVSAFILDLFY